VLLLEPRTLSLLRGPHGATTAQFSFTDPVDIVRGTDQEIQIEGPVLAVFEGSEAIEDEGFRWRCSRSQTFMEEQAVSAETLGLALERAVGDAELSADLP
jgi:hypothetical protein